VVGNIEKLGLEKLGVTTDHGTIVTDDLGKTNVPGIYAIGDVAGPPMLAHKAEHEGVICVEAIKGLHPHPLEKLKIPYRDVLALSFLGQLDDEQIADTLGITPITAKVRLHHARQEFKKIIAARCDFYRNELSCTPASPECCTATPAGTASDY
jgi:NADH dehydrogenase FAD-containing subunit